MKDDDQENDRMNDLSQSVNRACDRWLRNRGLKTQNWNQIHKDQKEAKRLKQESQQSDKCK